METINPDRADFLIKITPDYFLAEIDGSQISGTSVPSAAFRATYSTADKICAGLRRRGYPGSHVCTALGSPVTMNMLAVPSVRR
jgi:hypothetical protein